MQVRSLNKKLRMDILLFTVTNDRVKGQIEISKNERSKLLLKKKIVYNLHLKNGILNI